MEEGGLTHDLDSCECSSCGAQRRRLLRTGDAVIPIAPDREKTWEWGDVEPGPPTYSVMTWDPREGPGSITGSGWIMGNVGILLGSVPSDHELFALGIAVIILPGAGIRLVHRDRLVRVQIEADPGTIGS